MLRTSLRWTTRIACLAFVAFALLAIAGIGEEVGPLRTVKGSVVVPFEIRTGEEYNLEFDVLNDGYEPALLVGFLRSCGMSCYSGPELPISIPARGRARASVQIKTNAAGAFSEEVTFFTDRPTQPKLVILIEGTIRDARDHESSSRRPSAH